MHVLIISVGLTVSIFAPSAPRASVKWLFVSRDLYTSSRDTRAGICSDEVPFYIVMEYMNNGSLVSLLQEGPLLPIRVKRGKERESERERETNVK